MSSEDIADDVRPWWLRPIEEHDRERCQRLLIFRLGRCAGLASRHEIARLFALLWAIGRTPTETYTIAADEAGFIAATVALLRDRWLAIEVPQRDARAVKAGEAALTASELAELRDELSAAAAQALALEACG